MLRKLLLLFVSLSSAGLACADDQVVPGPSELVCGQSLDDLKEKPPQTGPLSREQRVVLADLFRQLAGEWHGRMEEQVCMLNGSVRQYGSASTLAIRAGSDSLRLSGDDSRDGSKSHRTHRRSFYVSHDALRVDNRQRAGNVELLRANENALAFVRNYRSSRRVDVDTSQPAGVLAGALSVPQSKADAQTEGQDTKQATRLLSQTHQERYYLELEGAGSLRITQQFFQQGRYIGSNRWRLARD